MNKLRKKLKKLNKKLAELNRQQIKKVEKKEEKK